MRHFTLIIGLVSIAVLISAGLVMSHQSEHSQLELAELESPFAESRQCGEQPVLGQGSPSSSFRLVEGPDCIIGCWEGRAACIDNCINAGGSPSCFNTCTANFNACKENCSGTHGPFV